MYLFHVFLLSLIKYAQPTQPSVSVETHSPIKSTNILSDLIIFSIKLLLPCVQFSYNTDIQYSQTCKHFTYIVWQRKQMVFILYILVTSSDTLYSPPFRMLYPSTVSVAHLHLLRLRDHN